MDLNFLVYLVIIIILTIVYLTHPNIFSGLIGVILFT